MKQESKDVVNLLCDLVNLVVSAEADGHIGLEDLPAAMKLVPEFIPAFSGISQVPSELSSMSDADQQEMIKYISDRLEIPNEKAKKVISCALVSCSSLFELYKAIKE